MDWQAEGRAPRLQPFCPLDTATRGAWQRGGFSGPYVSVWTKRAASRELPAGDAPGPPASPEACAVRTGQGRSAARRCAWEPGKIFCRRHERSGGRDGVPRRCVSHWWRAVSSSPAARGGDRPAGDDYAQAMQPLQAAAATCQIAIDLRRAAYFSQREGLFPFCLPKSHLEFEISKLTRHQRPWSLLITVYKKKNHEKRRSAEPNLG